jgi:hypothetical protein
LRASIWTYGKPNSDQGARRYAPAAQTSLKSDKLSSEAVLGMLSSFPSKPMNTKVEHNFDPHNLDTESAFLESGRGRYDVGIEGMCNRKVWVMLILWKPILLLTRKISCKARWSTPHGSQGYKYNP